MSRGGAVSHVIRIEKEARVRLLRQGRDGHGEAKSDLRTSVGSSYEDPANIGSMELSRTCREQLVAMKGISEEVFVCGQD